MDESFRCPSCDTPRRTLKQWLTCCPESVRAMTEVAAGHDELARLTRGLASPRMRKAAEQRPEPEDDGSPSWEQEWEAIEGGPFELTTHDE